MKTIVEYLINNHVKNTGEYVDLGLPSCTLWGKYNIGVDPTHLNKPEDWYGLYFAWGDTQGYKASDKHMFNWDTYKFGTQDKLTKYNLQDKLNQLEYKDDAVYQYTHGIYIMPTDKELKELYQYTDNEWITNYKGIPGLNGRLFTSKQSGNTNTLFIPASGFRYDNEIFSDNYFYLWSSVLGVGYYDAAHTYYANNKSNNIYISDRYTGCTIRGVLK